MKTITILTLLTVTLLTSGELEKEIRYLGSDGKTEQHQIICTDGTSGIVSIDLATREMSVDGENLGRATFQRIIKNICKQK